MLLRINFTENNNVMSFYRRTVALQTFTYMYMYMITNLNTWSFNIFTIPWAIRFLILKPIFSVLGGVGEN